MKIHFIHPFSLEKRYGKELNEAMSIIPEGDWACIMDWDCMLLSSEQVPVMYEYIKRNPDAGMLVACSNRSGSLSQRISGRFDNEGKMSIAHNTAKLILSSPIKVTEINWRISGFLMLISKNTWNQHKFNEDVQVLNVDRLYTEKLFRAGKKILLMESIYVWHSYRIWKDTKDISHLI